MYIETASCNPCDFVAEQFFVPWLIGPGRPHSHLTIIVQQLYTNLYAFVADKAGGPFKKSRHFPLAQTTKRTAQDRMLRLRTERLAEVGVRVD